MGVALRGARRDVVFVATQRNNVYAFDASTGERLWSRNYGAPARTSNIYWTVPQAYQPYHDLTPRIGITSTPVIDRETNTLYFTTFTEETVASGPRWHHWVHAVDLAGGTRSSGTRPKSRGSSPGIRSYMTGGILSISANGTSDGVIWATTPTNNDANPQTVPGILRAYDLRRELWNWCQNRDHDDFGNFAEFTPPTVANGRVYLATFSNQLSVYGLLSGAPASWPANLIRQAPAIPIDYSNAYTRKLIDAVAWAAIDDVSLTAP
jgi:hypothetical protein